MFVEVLREYRQELGFLLIGWVLMPEHFHFLIKPEPAESTSRLLQELKKRTAQRVVSVLTENQGHAWRRKMLNGLRLPPSVHSDSKNQGVAHTSRRSLAGCMRPLERGADMPNYGTSAPPVTVFHEFSRAEGPKGHT
jgi:hypothetical protein